MLLQFPNDELNQKAIEMSLKHDEEIVCRNATVVVDEEIVCRNATVVVDSKGNISWFDNDVPLCIITED